MRKLVIIGLATFFAIALLGCGGKEEIVEGVPTVEECEVQLKEEIDAIIMYEVDAPVDEIATKLSEAGESFVALSATFAAYGEDYADVADMAKKTGDYYSAKAAFTGLDVSDATEEEKNIVYDGIDAAQPGWDEVKANFEIE